jgi:hypothetical protein
MFYINYLHDDLNKIAYYDQRSMCNKKSVEDEYHFILECDRSTYIRCKYINKYYYRNPSTFKLIQ